MLYITAMPRKPKEENKENPLRLLRACLSKEGPERPITQGKLAEITGVRPATIRSIENGVFKLTDTVLRDIVITTGADWDEAEKRWIIFDSTDPFKRQHYDEFRHRSMQRPANARELKMDLLARIDLLFDLTPDSRWWELYFRFKSSMPDFCEDFKMDQLIEIHDMCRKRKPKGEGFDQYYQEQLDINGLQKEDWANSVLFLRYRSKSQAIGVKRHRNA